MKRILSSIAMLLLLSVAVPVGAQGNIQDGKRVHKVRKIFRRLDTNRDHQISRDEWKRQPKAFDRIDLNHDGVLSAEELKNRRRRRFR